MDLLKRFTAADIICARKENRLEELLPSGASIPFKFTTGEKNSFDVGRDSRYTYLILHDIAAGSSIMNNAPVDEGGWPASRMRNVIRDLFQSLPDNFKKAAIPVTIQQKCKGQDIKCKDKAFLLSATNVFGYNPWPLSGDHEDTQIDIFRDLGCRTKKRNGGKEPASWCLRSPCDINHFAFVDRNGKMDFDCAYFKDGIIFAICIEDRKPKK